MPKILVFKVKGKITLKTGSLEYSSISIVHFQVSLILRFGRFAAIGLGLPTYLL